MSITKYLSMKKNTSHEIKVNELSEILNEKFEKNGSTINKARIKLMSMVILALCKLQNVSFHKLALAFDTESKPGSSLRRLQRFVADFNLCKDLIARLIFSILPEKENLKLVIDCILIALIGSLANKILIFSCLALPIKMWLFHYFFFS